MKYDFDQVISRRHSDSIKWNVEDNELPMWVADMDFKTAPEITKALQKRVEQGIYGYTEPDDSWYDAYISFFKDRYDFIFDKEDLVFSLGVVPTISSTVRKITNVGDNVVVLSPVYNIFYNSIVNNNRKVLEVPLIYKNYQYSIDFLALEEAFKLDNTSLLIFCNPANPISKIWSKEDMIKIGELANKYNVKVISDEIHCQLTRPGTKYIPFAMASKINKDISITCIAPTKAFNLAGIHSSAIVIFNEDLRKKVVRQINTDEVAEPNIFSCIASTAAFNEGREYLDQLREYLFSNRDYVKEYISKNIPSIHLIDGDATYLLWLDVSSVSKDSDILASFIRENTGLFLSKGSVYGKGGQGFLRMNVACPKETLIDGLNRLKKGIEQFLNQK